MPQKLRLCIPAQRCNRKLLRFFRVYGVKYEYMQESGVLWVVVWSQNKSIENYLHKMPILSLIPRFLGTGTRCSAQSHFCARYSQIACRHCKVGHNPSTCSTEKHIRAPALHDSFSRLKKIRPLVGSVNMVADHVRQASLCYLEIDTVVGHPTAFD